MSLQSMVDAARKATKTPSVTGATSGAPSQKSPKRKAYVNWQGQCEFFSRGERKTQKLSLSGASKVTLYQNDYEQCCERLDEVESHRKTADMLQISQYQNNRNMKMVALEHTNSALLLQNARLISSAKSQVNTTKLAARVEKREAKKERSVRLALARKRKTTELDLRRKLDAAQAAHHANELAMQSQIYALIESNKTLKAKLRSERHAKSRLESDNGHLHWHLHCAIQSRATVVTTPLVAQLADIEMPLVPQAPPIAQPAARPRVPEVTMGGCEEPSTPPSIRSAAGNTPSAPKAAQRDVGMDASVPFGIAAPPDLSSFFAAAATGSLLQHDVALELPKQTNAPQRQLHGLALGISTSKPGSFGVSKPQQTALPTQVDKGKDTSWPDSTSKAVSAASALGSAATVTDSPPKQYTAAKSSTDCQAAEPEIKSLNELEAERTELEAEKRKAEGVERQSQEEKVLASKFAAKQKAQPHSRSVAPAQLLIVQPQRTTSYNPPSPFDHLKPNARLPGLVGVAQSSGFTKLAVSKASTFPPNSSGPAAPGATSLLSSKQPQQKLIPPNAAATVWGSIAGSTDLLSQALTTNFGKTQATSPKPRTAGTASGSGTLSPFVSNSSQSNTGKKMTGSTAKAKQSDLPNSSVGGGDVVHQSKDGEVKGYDGMKPVKSPFL